MLAFSDQVQKLLIDTALEIGYRRLPATEGLECPVQRCRHRPRASFTLLPLALGRTPQGRLFGRHKNGLENEHSLPKYLENR